VVLGPIFSFLRTSDGTETCPRLVILVRISANLQCEREQRKQLKSLSCNLTFYLSHGHYQRRVAGRC